MSFNLTPRQKNILFAVVMDYISTAEPVGSRTIAKRYELGLSPATIRNDMAELEELGLLVQPHSSAGRIPSQLGYRNFVDFLMEKTSLSDFEVNKIKNIPSVNLKLDSIIEQSAKVLSVLSNTVAIIQFPESNKEYVRHFQILPISSNMFVLILVSNTGNVHDYRVQLDSHVDESFFQYLTNYFHEQLIGTPINKLQSKIQMLIKSNFEYEQEIRKVYSSIRDYINNDKNKICVAGTSNLLKEPEFNETEKAHSLIDFFEDEENSNELSEIFMNLSHSLSIEQHPKILIGKEIKISQLQDCSLIVGSYKIGDELSGAIGLLGPTRMQYSKSIAALEEMTKNLSYLLTKIYGIDDD